MSDTVKPYVDPVSGRETTGHEWDEIRELNNPLPLVARPALRDDRMVDPLLGGLPVWPLVSDYTRGLFGYSQRAAVIEEVAAARAARGAQVRRSPRPRSTRSAATRNS